MKLAAVCTCVVWVAAIAGCVCLSLHEHVGMALAVLAAGLSVSLQLWHSCRAGITEQGAHPRWLEARQQLVECVDYSAYRAMLGDALDPANGYFAKRFPLLLLGLESFR